MQDLSALSVQTKAQKSAPLPARDVCSHFANIRRNREAKERFADSLWSANAHKARYDLIIGAHHFAESEKSANRENAPWFRVNFDLAKLGLGEAQEVLAYSRSDKAIKRHVFLLLLPRFSFEQRKA